MLHNALQAPLFALQALLGIGSVARATCDSQPAAETVKSEKLKGCNTITYKLSPLAAASVQYGLASGKEKLHSKAGFRKPTPCLQPASSASKGCSPFPPHPPH